MGNMCSKKNDAIIETPSNTVKNPIIVDKKSPRLAPIPEDKSIVHIDDYKTPNKVEIKPLTTSNVEGMNKSNNNNMNKNKNKDDIDADWGDTSSISTSRSNFPNSNNNNCNGEGNPPSSARSIKSSVSNKSCTSTRQTDAIPAEKTGDLYKKGKTFGTYKKRYFVLQKGILKNYSTEEDSNGDASARDDKVINLKGYNLIVLADKMQFILECRGKKVFLESKNRAMFETWNSKLAEHVAYANGYYHLVLAASASSSAPTTPMTAAETRKKN